MKEQMIEQLWYTWSGIGIRKKGIGLQIRAASPGLINPSESLYRFIQRCADYRLPEDADQDSPNGPVCLALMNTPYGRFLLRKEYVGQDLFGRGGNFFTHLLSSLPDNFTARDAIRLWNSPFWQSHDVPEQEQSTRLAPLSLEDLKEGEQHFNFTEVQDYLHSLISAYLAPSRLQQRLFIKGTSEQIVMLIWGLTHSLPKTLFPSEFTFTTYENDVNNSSETIVGTTTANIQLPQNQSNPSIKFIPEPQISSNTEVETSISTFVDFATECLAQTSNGHSSQLEHFIEQAEKAQIADVNTFITFFKRHIIKNDCSQIINELEAALKRNDWSTVEQVCILFSTTFPPMKNSEAWHSLFQTASEEFLRNKIINQKAIHQWLFDGLIAASPETISELSRWLSGSWNDLDAFLSLNLPDQWYREAISILLLSHHLDRTSVEVVKRNESLFLEVLQQFALTTEKEYIEAISYFFSEWKPDIPLKSDLITSLINTEGITPETRQQLNTFAQSVLPFTRQETGYHVPQQVDDNILEEVQNQKNPVAKLITYSFQLGKLVLLNRANKSIPFRTFTIVIALLLLTNILSFCAAITRSSTNDPIVRATAFAEGKTTLLVQHAQTVTAIAQAEEGTDSDKIIGYYPQNLQVNAGTQFSIYVIIRNTGTSTWSDTRGYRLACVPPQGTDIDPDCQNASSSGFIGGTLAPNQTYVLSITITAAKLGQHHITLSLTHNKQFFGSQQIAIFLVKN